MLFANFSEPEGTEELHRLKCRESVLRSELACRETGEDQISGAAFGNMSGTISKI